MQHIRITKVCGVAACLALGLWAAPAPAQAQPGGNFRNNYGNTGQNANGLYNQGYPNPAMNRGGANGQWQGFNNPYGQPQNNYGNFANSQPGYNPGFASGNNPNGAGYGNSGYGNSGHGNSSHGNSSYGNSGYGNSGYGPYSVSQGGTADNGMQHYYRGFHEGYQRGFQEGMGRPGMRTGTGQRDFMPVRVTGEIDQTKNVKLPGIQQGLLVAQVTTATGQTVLVNLGPVEGLGTTKFQAGESITVHGLLCQRAFPPVVFAEHVRAKGKRLTIEAFDGMEPERQTVRGKLEKLQKVQLPGMRDTMLIGLVKSQQGQTVIVDFGSSDQSGDLDLKEGTQVRVRGDGVELGEQQVLFANQVRANGQTLTLGD